MRTFLLPATVAVQRTVIGQDIRMATITSGKTVPAKIFLSEVLGNPLSETWVKGDGVLFHRGFGMPSAWRALFPSNSFQSELELQAVVREALGHGHWITEEEGANHSKLVDEVLTYMMIYGF